MRMLLFDPILKEPEGQQSNHRIDFCPRKQTPFKGHLCCSEFHKNRFTRNHWEDHIQRNVIHRNRKTKGDKQPNRPYFWIVKQVNVSWVIHPMIRALYCSVHLYSISSDSPHFNINVVCLATICGNVPVKSYG